LNQESATDTELGKSVRERERERERGENDARESSEQVMMVVMATSREPAKRAEKRLNAG
jgi:hypothetical protein